MVRTFLAVPVLAVVAALLPVSALSAQAAPASPDSPAAPAAHEVVASPAVVSGAEIAQRSKHRPRARADRYRVREDGVLRVRRPGVLKNDRDRRHRLRAKRVSGPKHGKARLRRNGKLVYRPAADHAGRDSLRYRAVDKLGRRDAARVRIRVLPVNDAPTFTSGPDQQVTTDAGPQTVAGWATAISPGPDNEADQAVTFAVEVVDGADLLAGVPSVGSDGSLSFEPADAVLTEPATATVQVIAVDDGGTKRRGVDRSTPATLRIDVAPAVPGDVLLTTIASALEGAEVPLAAVASELPGPLTYRFDCEGDGSFESPLLPTGAWVCTYPDDGPVTPLVEVVGAEGDPVTATTSLLIENVAPLVAGPDAGTVVGGVLGTLPLGSFSDPGLDGPWQVLVDWGDGQTDTLTSAVPGPLGSLSHAFEGQATTLTRTVTVTVTEAGGAAAGSASFLVTVLPVSSSENTPPTAGDFAVVGTLLAPLALTDAEILDHVSDADGDPLTLTDLTGPPGLTITRVAGGWTLLPTTLLGTGSFPLAYTVTDGVDQATGTITMTVQGLL